MENKKVIAITLILLIISSAGLATAKTTITWEKTYPGEVNQLVSAIIQTSDKGYLLAARGGPAGTDESLNAYMIKIDAFGNIRWTQSYISQGYDFPVSVIQTNNKQYVLCGYTNSLDGVTPFILKADAVGNTVWVKTYSDMKNMLVLSAIQTKDNGYLMAGILADSIYANNGKLWISSFNSDGEQLWLKIYNDARTVVRFSDSWSLLPSNNAGFTLIVTGVTSEPRFVPQLMFFNKNGDIISVKDLDANVLEANAAEQMTNLKHA
jgi:hypothetical protein